MPVTVLVVVAAAEKKLLDCLMKTSNSNPSSNISGYIRNRI